MAENEGWIRRVIGRDPELAHVRAELASARSYLEGMAHSLRDEQDKCARKDADLAALRAQLHETSTGAGVLGEELAGTKQALLDAHEELRLEQEKVRAAETELTRAMARSRETEERSRLQVEAEKLKAKSAYSQVQGLERRVEGFQEQGLAREKEIAQLHATVSQLEGKLVASRKLEDSAKAKGEELARATAEWSKVRAALDETIHGLRTNAEESSGRMARFEASLKAAEARAVSVEDVLKKEREGTATLRTEAAALRAEVERAQQSYDTLAREERLRWMLLVNRFWRALERSLGTGAALSLSAALEQEGSSLRLAKAPSPEGALRGLNQAFTGWALASDVALCSTEDGVELRLSRPGAANDGSACAWVGVYAVQCLGSMLGKGMRTASIGQQGSELVVRARYLEPHVGEELAG